MSDSAASAPGFLPKEPPRRPVFVAAVAWLAALDISLILYGCPRFTTLYAVFLAFTLALTAAVILFLRAIFLQGRRNLLLAFRKLVGYALTVVYVAQALPRVDWMNAGAIGSGRTVFLYVITLVCTAMGGALFIIMTRKKVLVSFGVISEEEAKDKALLKEHRKTRKRGTLVWLLEWVDSLAFAVILVLLIDVFVFQIYAVPTESMVPVFLAGDRPFTAKLIAGPRLPLTDWRLPFVRQPARGDVVTIANPAYQENHGVSLKKYLAQVVYMITFTGVNIDRDINGQPKADPLVKRVVGVPGEKLMMVDDVLYHRTASQPDFTPVEADKRYAQVDLWKLPQSVRSHIGSIPIDERRRAILSKWDARKNAADPSALAGTLSSEWASLSRAFESIPASAVSSYIIPPEALAIAPAGENNAFAAAGIVGDDTAYFLAAARSASVRAALREYATSGESSSAGLTAYERGSRVLNLLIKRNLIQRLFRDAELAQAGSISGIPSDERRFQLIQERNELGVYLDYYDMRNFPEFPSGSAFLGPNEYFAMGDNRYNSQDFRFTGQFAQRRLDPSDPTSIQYPSQIGPFPLEKRYIESYALFRLWPFTRFGAIR